MEYPKGWCFAAVLALSGAPAYAGTYVVCSKSPGGSVVVDGVSTQMPDIVSCEFVDDGLGGWDGGDGGEWGNPGSGGVGPECAALFLSKPSGCTGPQDTTDPSWGESDYAIGSGLASAIYNLHNNPAGMDTSTTAMVRTALSRHTSDLARLTLPTDQVNATLIQGMADACENQYRLDSSRTNMQGQPLTSTPAIHACFGTLSRLSGEASGDFGSFFTNYIQRLGINLEDLGIPRVLINWASPENSLRLKLDSVEAGARCNIWFQRVQQEGC